MLERLMSATWALEENYHATVMALALSRLDAGKEAIFISEGERERRLKAGRPTTLPVSGKVSGLNVSGNVRVLTIDGAMSRDGGFCSYGTEYLSEEIRKANADSNVSAILLKINSGGGDVDGTEQLGQAIRDSAKPVVSFVAGMAASAAYWAASQAREIVMETATTSYVGSIGVLAVHADATEALKQKGYKIEIIRADGSENKALVNDAEAMTDEIRMGMKTMLNSIRETFLATVKSGRPGIDNSVFDGKMFDGNAAIKRKMADRVGTMADALGRAVYHARRDENKKASINQISNMENQKTVALLGVQASADLEETSVQAIETALNERDAAVAELATARIALEDANKKVTLLGEQVADHGVISGKLKAFEDTGKSAIEVQILADWHANMKGIGITPGADASNVNGAKTYSSATAKAMKAAGI